MERRTALKNLGGMLLAPAIADNQLLSASKTPALRIAHLTDIHLKDKFDAPARFTRCLAHLEQLKPHVNLVLNGGDIVFDMNKESLGAINAQWALYKSIIKNCSAEVRYCLGNHDIWWAENNKGQSVYGKQYSLDQLAMASRYYSFTKAGWKFIVLDSVHLDIDNTWYIGKLDPEQYAWLESELQKTDKETPVLVLSHIPILTATNLIEDDIINKWVMLGGDMHTDTSKIIKLFYKHPNVKLCLSGHIHLREKLVYNNVTYICNGAVSGAWWEGNRRETAPGYGVIDLYADGTFQEQYVTY